MVELDHDVAAEYDRLDEHHVDCCLCALDLVVHIRLVVSHLRVANNEEQRWERSKERETE